MIAKGIVWDFLGKASYQGVGFVISIFLARLLFPEDFGLIGMVMAFIGIAGVFIDMGLGAAIIQREDIQEIHLSSVFWINLTVALSISILCFLGAPIVSSFYNNSDILKLAKVLSFTFLFSGLSSIHRSILIRKMDFKYLAKIGVISAIISGTIGIVFAYRGYGVWSLVIQNYLSLIISSLLLWKGTKWLPSLIFNWKAIKPLWSYSNKLFISSILEAIYSRIDVFIIGKLFNSSILGYYSRGVTINQLVANYSSGSLNTVLFPALSKIQNDISQVKVKIIKFYNVAAFLAFLMGGVLFLTSEDLIVLLFSEKWLPTSKYFEILVLSSFVYPLSAVILTPLRSLGYSSTFLKLEIIKKIFLSIALIVGFTFGIMEYLYALTISQFIGLALNGYYAGKKINWTIIEQLLTLSKYIIIVVVSVIIVFFSNKYLTQMPRAANFLLNSIAFILIYLTIAYITKNKGFIILSIFVKEKVSQYKKPS